MLFVCNSVLFWSAVAVSQQRCVISVRCSWSNKGRTLMLKNVTDSKTTFFRSNLTQDILGGVRGCRENSGNGMLNMHTRTGTYCTSTMLLIWWELSTLFYLLFIPLVCLTLSLSFPHTHTDTQIMGWKKTNACLSFLCLKTQALSSY